MIMRKETLVFLTSLAIIFIIGYVNMTMTPKNAFNEEDYAQFEENLQAEAMDENISEILENENDFNGAALVEVLEQTDTTDLALDSSKDVIVAEDDEEVAITETEEDFVILGDITDIIKEDNSVVASSEGILNVLNTNFANFRLNKEKGNMDVVDHLEQSLSSESISVETKGQFEALLLNKNGFIEAERSIELMLQSKGYNETAVIVDGAMVKVVTNDSIEQADATKILDVIVSETNYEPSQIKIVKFDNIDL